MTYSAVYCALISKRLKNPITKDDCYVERHHIIPKSEGGLDEPDNLVYQTQIGRGGVSKNDENYYHRRDN